MKILKKNPVPFFIVCACAALTAACPKAVWALDLAPDLPADTEEVVLDHADSAVYDPVENRTDFIGNVRLSYGPMDLSADEVSIHNGTSEFSAWGNLFLRDEDLELRADYVRYDVQTGNGVADNVFLFNDPFRIRGQHITVTNRDRIVVERGMATTCEEEVPHVSLRFSRMELERNHRIRLRGAGLFVKNIPIFYIPYLSMPTSREAAYEGIQFRAGEESFGGATVSTVVNYVADQANRGNVSVDYRFKRGPGGGMEHTYAMPAGSVAAGGYIAHDRRFPARETRGTAWLRYHQRHSNDFRTFGEFTYVTDSSFRADYFYDQFRREREPRASFTAAYSRPHYYMQATVIANPNPESYSFIERLPEIHVGIPDVPLFGTGLYGNIFSRSTWFRLKDLTAADTQHFRQDGTARLAYPVYFPGCVTVTPFVEAEATYYSRGLFTRDPLTRYLVSEGVTLSTRRRQDWFHDFLNWQNIRHIVRPELTFRNRDLHGARPSELIQYEEVDRLDGGRFVEFRLDNYFYGLHARRGQELISKIVLTSVYDLDLPSHDRFTDFDGIAEFWINPRLTGRAEFEYDPARGIMDRLAAGGTYNSEPLMLSASIAHSNGTGGNKDARSLGLGARWRINYPWEVDVQGTYNLTESRVDDARYTFNWYLDCLKMSLTYRDQESLDRKSFMFGVTFFAFDGTPLNLSRSVAGD